VSRLMRQNCSVENSNFSVTPVSNMQINPERKTLAVEKRIKHVCKVRRNNLQALLQNCIFGSGVFLAAPCRIDKRFLHKERWLYYLSQYTINIQTYLQQNKRTFQNLYTDNVPNNTRHNNFIKLNIYYSTSKN